MATKKTATKKAATKKTATKKAPKKPPAKKASSTSNSVVAEFLAGVAAPHKAIVQAVEAVVLDEVKGAISVIKWGHPVWEKDGRPFALTKSLKDYVLLGFWNSKDLVVPGVKLEGNALKQLQFTSVDQVDQPGVRKAIQAALKLNAG